MAKPITGKQFLGGPKDGDRPSTTEAQQTEVRHRVHLVSTMVHIYVRCGDGSYEYRGVAA